MVAPHPHDLLLLQGPEQQRLEGGGHVPDLVEKDGPPVGLLKQARENKSMSAWPQLFSEYKRDEIVNIYKGKGTAKEKEDIYETFSTINPSQRANWNKIKE